MFVKRHNFDVKIISIREQLGIVVKGLALQARDRRAQVRLPAKERKILMMVITMVVL